MDKQNDILTAIAAVAAGVAAIDGDASAAKQDEILDEIKILTTGLQTY